MANELTRIKLLRLKQFMKMMKSNKNLHEKVSDLHVKYEINDDKLSFFQKNKAKSYLKQAIKNQLAFDNFYKENQNLIQETFGENKDNNQLSELKAKDREDLLSEIKKDEYKDLNDDLLANKNLDIKIFIKYNQETLEKMLNIKKEAQQISNDKTEKSENNFTTPVNSNKKQSNQTKNPSIPQGKQQVTTNPRYFKL